MPQNHPPHTSLSQVLTHLKKLNPILNDRWGIHILAVFGSVGREEDTAKSDIDLLFDYDTPIGLELVSVGDYLEEQLGRKVDLLSKKAVRPTVWQFIQHDMRYV